MHLLGPRKQYAGDFSVVTWNSQALFSADQGKHRSRARYLGQLMGSHDVGFWTETHGTKDGNSAWRGVLGCKSWWSPGPTTGVAGVGITVREQFLHRFTSVRWEVVLPGRSAILHLAGPDGSLDLVVVYFHTGADLHPQDVLDAGLHRVARPPGAPDLREALRHRLATRLRCRDEVLTVIAGDFNYVSHPDDRFCVSSGRPTGFKDSREANQWQRTVEGKFGLHELHQPDMTYAGGESRSRIDRIYTNMHEVNYLDRRIACAALGWTPHLSRHRPVSARRSHSVRHADDIPPISDLAVEHTDWPRQVALAWHDLCRAHPGASGLKQLVLFKQAMREAERTINRRMDVAPPPEDLEDSLGTACKLLRAIEHGNPERVSRCLARYPLLDSLLHNPYDFVSPIGPRTRRLREHIQQLAHGHTLHELQRFHDDLKDLSPVQANRRRQRNHRLVCRLAPGRGCSNFAMTDDTGIVSADPHFMLQSLKKHWEAVFTRKHTDPVLRRKWLEQDKEGLPPESSMHIPRGMLTPPDFLKAIEHSGNSAPGRDGLTFKAWRKLGVLASEVLHRAFLDMVRDDHCEIMEEDYPDFNEALMVFLPKKAVGTSDSGLDIFTAEGTRPLSITNTDNRLIGSAVRMFVEPLVEPSISDEQRGFLCGRSMLSNVLDIEEAMMDVGMTEEEGCAVMFDFQAAFPSVDHGFIHDTLRSRGWPQWTLNFVQLLYSNNYCWLSVGGGRQRGFHVTAGVRQGCPLSPLLFSVISDVLLRKLKRSCPGAVTRAYADDLAMVLPTGVDALGHLEEVFREYELISALHLHHGKSVLIPLSLESHEKIYEELVRRAPGWSDLGIADCARYLGFVLGPGRGQNSWTTAVNKMRCRARIWRSVGAGMCVSLQAMRMYILPLASFLVQLECLPLDWKSVERELVTTLFPGPRGWCPPDVMRHLTDIGFPLSLPDMSRYADAAKCRVVRWEAVARGGLQVRRRHEALQRRFERSDFLGRRALWQGWLSSNFFSNLVQAHDKLVNVAVSKGLRIRDLLQRDGEAAVPKEQWQRRCAAALVPASGSVHGVPLLLHLRRHLDRWQLPLLPGRRVQRACAALAALGQTAPPCVWAAVFRAMVNGWTTAARMQRRGPCSFRCGAGEDCLRHYASCPTAQRLAQRLLGLPPLTGQEATLRFLGLRRGSAAELRLAAVHTYAIYRASNAVRGGSADASAVYRQALRDVL